MVEAGLPLTSQRLVHNVTGAHIETGFKGVYSYAKKVFAKTGSFDAVADGVSAAIMQHHAAQQRANDQKGSADPSGDVL
jgi:hypothetical protein